MNLDKAIEILTDHTHWCDEVKECDTFDALNLGIEALIRIHDYRDFLVECPGEVLPGETED